MSTFQRLRRLIAEALRIDEADVQPDSLLAELFARSGAGSLDRIEFVMALRKSSVVWKCRTRRRNSGKHGPQQERFSSWSNSSIGTGDGPRNSVIGMGQYHVIDRPI